MAGVDDCLKLGVDHLGFNFVKSSRRYIDPRRAKPLAERARGQAQLVGVFMDQPLEEILNVLETVPLDAVQLHGSESPRMCAQLPIPVWKVFAVGLGWDPSVISRYPDVAVRLFDTAAKNGVSGGTGKIFDWNLLPSHPEHPWYLAGGLAPDNLSTAITLCRPDGVDLNSGVESAPGIKDPVKLRAAMDILSVWKTQAVVVGLPGRPAGTVHVEGAMWPCWKVGSQRQEESIEMRGLLDLLEIHHFLVLDLGERWNHSFAEVSSDLIRWQMLARENGRQVRFRVPDSIMESLVRMSVVPLLELVD